MVACWRPVGSGGIYGGLEARLVAAAGGSIRACWVFMELGVVTPAWATWWCVAVVLRNCAARLLAAVCAWDPMMLRQWIVIVR